MEPFSCFYGPVLSLVAFFTLSALRNGAESPVWGFSPLVCPFIYPCRIRNLVWSETYKDHGIYTLLQSQKNTWSFSLCSNTLDVRSTHVSLETRLSSDIADIDELLQKFSHSLGWHCFLGYHSLDLVIAP